MDTNSKPFVWRFVLKLEEEFQLCLMLIGAVSTYMEIQMNPEVKSKFDFFAYQLVAAHV